MGLFIFLVLLIKTDKIRGHLLKFYKVDFSPKALLSSFILALFSSITKIAGINQRGTIAIFFIKGPKMRYQ